MENRERFYSRGYLPHWNVPGATQFLTWRLADSLPSNVWEELSRRHPIADKTIRRKLWREVDRHLDSGHGSCLLTAPTGGPIVMEHLLRLHRKECIVESFVVMPNHVHALVTLDPGLKLSYLMQKLKGATSAEINRKQGRSGRLWQPDYFDRRIRNDEHFCKTVEYIEWNPVKAGLCAHPTHFRLSSRHPQVAAELLRTEVRGPDAD